MQTIQFIVFLVSAILVPVLTSTLIRARMPLSGKLILGGVLFLVARYLLGAVWVPEEVWALTLKAVAIAISAWCCWNLLYCAMIVCKARAWTLFALYLALPLVLCSALGSSSLAWGGPYGGNRVWWSPHLVNTVFWGVWVIVAWMVSFAVPSSKMGRILLFAASVLAIAFFASATLRERTAAAGGDVIAVIRENVATRWPSVNQQTAKIVAAWEKAIAKDRQIVAQGKVGTGKLQTATNIGQYIRKLRRDLLPVDSRALLGDVSRLDSKIEKCRKTLSGLREKRLLSPERAEALDAKISKEEARLADLESGRAAAIARARDNLKAIGLELPEGSVFLTVDLGDIVDNAIVAKDIGVVVENLKSLMDAEKGDAAAAKRYYGAYIVMLDVQSECFRQYLGKAKTGIWRDGVEAIARDAEAAMKKNEAKAAAPDATEFEKKAFRQSAGTNERTLKAAKAYIAILERHAEIVQEKLAAAERMHGVALSFWESADIASAFDERITSDLTEFEALLELKLPEIAFFDDMAMQAEFDAITQKLMKE